VKEHLASAGDLPFQLGLKGVTLTEEQTIDYLLGGFYARRSIEEVVHLAWDQFSEVCLCALFSLMRSASLLTALGIPRFAGPSPKEEEEGDSKKRPHT
jgi:hypothetical protein